MDSYPKQVDLSPAQWKVCQFANCGQCYQTFSGLIAHIHKAHEIASQEMPGHWLLAARQSEQRKDQLGERESEFVRPAFLPDGSVVEEKFQCLACGKILSKSTCVGHMEGHDLDPTVVKKWLTHKDSRTIENAKKASHDPSTRLRLTQALLQLIAESPEQGGDEPQKHRAGAQASKREQDEQPYEEPQHIAQEERPAQSSTDGGTCWRKCLIKVDSAGVPVFPVEVQFAGEEHPSVFDMEPNASASPAPGAAPKSSPKSKRADTHKRAPPTHPAGKRGSSPQQEAAAPTPQDGMQPEGMAPPAVKKARVLERQESAASEASEGGSLRGAMKLLTKSVATLIGAQSRKGGGAGSNTAHAGSRSSAGPAPDVRISEFAATWSGDDWDAAALRHGFPLDVKHQVDLGTYEAYLKEFSRTSDTIGSNTQGVHMFFSCFDIVGATDPLAVMVKLYRSRAFNEALQLPVMHPRFPHTLKMLQGVKTLADHLFILATQQGDRKAAECMTLIAKHLIAPKKPLLSKYKKARKLIKKEREKMLKRKLAKWSDVKEAVALAMVDIASIANAHQQRPITKFQKYAATVAMAGIVFLGAPAGRPGEWAALKLSDTHAMVAGDEDHLEMAQHKTALTQGALGKYIPPSTKAAMKLFATLPSRSGLFFESQNPAKGGTQISKLLKRFGRDYLPGSHAASPTLLRKVYTSLVDETEGAAKSLIASFNAHLDETAEDIYNLTKAEADARKAKACVDYLLGGAVLWPEDKLTPENMTARLAILKKQSTRQRASRSAQQGAAPAAASSAAQEPAVAQHAPGIQQEVLGRSEAASACAAPSTQAATTESAGAEDAEGQFAKVDTAGDESAQGVALEGTGKAKRSRRTKAEMEAAQALENRHATRVYLDYEQQTYVFKQWSEAHSTATSMSGLLPWFTELVQQGIRDDMWTATQAPTAKGLQSMIRRTVFDRSEEGGQTN